MPATQFKVTDKFFKDLGAKAKLIVDEETQKMTNDMHFILRMRFPLKGGNGRWPISNKPASQGSHSFTGWKVQKRANGEYWLANHHESNTGFNYSRILAKGVGWNENVLLGHWRRLKTGTKVNGVFSTQMPNGLDPWLEIKRGDMESNIIQRMKKEL